MAKISCANEPDLFAAIRQNPGYQAFLRRELPRKRQRETHAWRILLRNRGGYTKENLREIFRTVDGGRFDAWWGQTLRGNNLKLLLGEDENRLNNWINHLLFANASTANRFATAIQDKISGTHTGFPSILLYLQNSDDAKVCLPTSLSSLGILGRFSPSVRPHNPAYYSSFCGAIRSLEQDYGFEPREMDFILWIIRKYTEGRRRTFVFDYDAVAQFKW